MTCAVETIRPVKLQSSKKRAGVRAVPDDRARYRVQRDYARDALRVAADRQQRFAKELDLLLFRLHLWIMKHPGKLRDAYVTLQDNRLAFIVVKSQAAYDADFEDSLSELDFEIANDANLEIIKLNTLAVPPVSGPSLSSFINPRFVLVYDGTRA